MMVYRLYVEKRAGFTNEADGLKNELVSFLGITALSSLRIFNRYDVENIDEKLFSACISTVFSEPAIDEVGFELPKGADAVFAVEYLPGQFDQRADSCAQCIQIISRRDRPAVRTAKVYFLNGKLSAQDVEKIKHYVINPVECREASLGSADTLALSAEEPLPPEKLEGFCALSDSELGATISRYGLAMDENDLKCVREYFVGEKREPTMTELRVLDTYWSDHCRHTTFTTRLENIKFAHSAAEKAFERYLELRRELGREERPITLMDIATIGAKALKADGKLELLDESDEINACTVKTVIEVNGKDEEWLVLFKNETHNHPTEIEPFGGAATCIGGAIRDPLSGRAYVYQAMRITGCADPRADISDTLKGKLPQRKLTVGAAEGFSSYGNQIGLATGIVQEFYHPGYVAKRLETGAVIGAAPAANVVRSVPCAGDVVILLGGRTGRDGCGGATGSSKSHSKGSLESCGAEVQKGNAPEERKLQRLFRNPEAVRLIKRCNDFGAGGVSVAVGELADGVAIELDRVLKKYDGLSATELAISESQERMAVVVEPKDRERFLELAAEENLEATQIAVVTAEPRLRMTWKGAAAVDIARSFLDTNGAKRRADAEVCAASEEAEESISSFGDSMRKRVQSLEWCSRRGLSERFDSTIGSGTLLMPFSGKYQLTPLTVMAARIPAAGRTTACTVMSYGFDPYASERDPYAGAYNAVLESVCRIAAAGAYGPQCYLSFQEFFERLRDDKKRWGKPLSALLGALCAQLDMGIAAIGGKDSMSGSFDELDVPPTLISFAAAVSDERNIISPEFKTHSSRVALIETPSTQAGIPDAVELKKNLEFITRLIKENRIVSAWYSGFGGIAKGIFSMTLGNKIGFEFDENIEAEELLRAAHGSFIVELSPDAPDVGRRLGCTTGEECIAFKNERLPLDELILLYEGTLEGVFPAYAKKDTDVAPVIEYRFGLRSAPHIKAVQPTALVPVFPGTNCEYDTFRALERAEIKPEIFVIRNLTPEDIKQSVEAFAQSLKKANIVFIPGGFSGGDEPDGSGKFITAFFRNPAISEGVNELIKMRDGLMLGVCNGFQALIKLGLVPFGEIREPAASYPTLARNIIGRHQSRIVYTRIASNKSPWLSRCEPGDLYAAPVSHGEGRFVCSEDLLKELAKRGQIATQYADTDGKPSMDILFNPNGSVWAVEGITSPDGRIFGKMAHAERIEKGIYKNVYVPAICPLFESAADYFKL